ncbi:hypothetical protein B7C62_13420 [Kitasatospora albolonga]|uniref:Uncharacterized protein n=1 Tax=Kitasatospora albolonga TaxID=68173 RepID=A0ABC8BRY5_9ACTN|nr:hypothetical protein B7C62_13420 [Kitasatospora albolonga]
MPLRRVSRSAFIVAAKSRSASGATKGARNCRSTAPGFSVISSVVTTSIQISVRAAACWALSSPSRCSSLIRSSVSRNGRTWSRSAGSLRTRTEARQLIMPLSSV